MDREGEIIGNGATCKMIHAELRIMGASTAGAKQAAEKVLKTSECGRTGAAGAKALLI
jgi:hypothetical protein